MALKMCLGLFVRLWVRLVKSSGWIFIIFLCLGQEIVVKILGDHDSDTGTFLPLQLFRSVWNNATGTVILKYMLASTTFLMSLISVLWTVAKCNCPWPGFEFSECFLVYNKYWRKIEGNCNERDETKKVRNISKQVSTDNIIVRPKALQ